MRRVGLGFALLLAGALALGQIGERVPLNSERIEARYGSYGIEVLASDASVRESNLFSRHDGTRITRTYAIVRYPQPVLLDYLEEHRAILDGGSIGAVFASRGWRVDKHNRLYATIEATQRLAAMMEITPGIELAVHIYDLEVVKDRTGFVYCAIAEVHHPDYLSVDDLERIYGSVPALGTAEQQRTESLMSLTLKRIGG